jgi:uncharacterized protein
MSVQNIQAIDVHGHYGTYRGEGNALYHGFMSADANTVVARARAAATELTLVSSLDALLPVGETEPVAGNEDAARVVAAFEGLRQWVVVHPLVPETYRQAERMLESPRCVGIKIHPESHRYPIARHGRAIFEWAAARRAVIETHSGEQNSLPADFVALANDYPEVRLILSHLGCGWDDDPSHQIRAIQAARHGNIYTDTSSAQSILPELIEWAVREIGPDRILYATDTPVHFAPMMRARIDQARISDEAKMQILRYNALKLFNLGGKEKSCG